MKKISFLVASLVSIFTLVSCQKKDNSSHKRVDDRPIARQIIEDYVEMGFGKDQLQFVSEVTKEDVSFGRGVAIFQNWLTTTMNTFYPSVIFTGYSYANNFFTLKDYNGLYNAKQLFNDLYYGYIDTPPYLKDWNNRLEEIVSDANGSMVVIQNPVYSSDYNKAVGLFYVDECDQQSRFLRRIFFAFGATDYIYTISDYINDTVGPNYTEEEAISDFEYYRTLFKTTDAGDLYMTFFQCGTAITEEKHYYTLNGVINDIVTLFKADSKSINFTKISNGSYRAKYELVAPSSVTPESLLTIVRSYQNYLPTYLEEIDHWAYDPIDPNYIHWLSEDYMYGVVMYTTEANQVNVEVVAYYIYDLGKIIVEITVS